MSALQLESLWQYIQTLSMPEANRRWLAERLIEPVNSKEVDVAQRETDYIMSSPEMAECIHEGDEQIRSGKYETTRLEDLWN